MTGMDRKSSLRGASSDRATTAEISRIREQTRRRRTRVGIALAAAAAVVGTTAYFVPKSYASGQDGVIIEGDLSQIEDAGELAAIDEFAAPEGEAVGGVSVEGAVEEVSCPAVDEAEAIRRSEKILETRLPEEGTYDPSTIIVTMADGTDNEDIDRVVTATGFTMTRRLWDGDGDSGSVIELDVSQAEDVNAAMSAVLADTNVHSCEPNLLAEEASDGTEAGAVVIEDDGAQDPSDPNDPYDDEHRKDIAALDWKGAWRQSRANGTNTVAVIDTGFYLDHAELQDTFIREAAWNVKESNDNVYPVDGHGTMVAGVISARANNNFGITGLSYDARVLPVQVASWDEMTNEKVKPDAADLIAALNYVNKKAEQYNVRVVNISLDVPVLANALKDDLYRACQALTNKGIVIVASAGTATDYFGSGMNLPAPACYDNVIGVINVQQNESNNEWEINPTSNHNKNAYQVRYQLAAPGTNILSCYPFNKALTTGDDPRDATIQSKGAFIFGSGTSLAAPQVSSLVSLMVAKSPRMTVDEIVAALKGQGQQDAFPVVENSIVIQPRKTLEGLTTTSNSNQQQNGNLEPLADPSMPDADASAPLEHVDADATVLEPAKNDAIFAPSQHADMAAAASWADATCYIGGRKYASFSPDTMSYTIQFGVSETLPEAPEFSNLPAGWRVAGIRSSADAAANGMRHSVTLTDGANPRMYQFTYAKVEGASYGTPPAGSDTVSHTGSVPGQKAAASDKAATPAAEGQGGTATGVVRTESAGSAEPTGSTTSQQGGGKGSAGTASSTGGSATARTSSATSSPLEAIRSRAQDTLTQTGDPVTVVACAAIVVATVAAAATLTRREKRAA